MKKRTRSQRFGLVEVLLSLIHIYVSIAHQEYGVATVKDSAFSAPVAEAVQAMLDDGTIKRLIDKWN